MNYKNFKAVIEMSMFNAVDAVHNLRNKSLTNIEKKAIYNITTHFLCQVVEYLDEDEDTQELSTEFLADFHIAKSESTCLEDTLLCIDTFTDYIYHEELNFRK